METTNHSVTTLITFFFFFFGWKVCTVHNFTPPRSSVIVMHTECQMYVHHTFSINSIGYYKFNVVSVCDDPFLSLYVCKSVCIAE